MGFVAISAFLSNNSARASSFERSVKSASSTTVRQAPGAWMLLSDEAARSAMMGLWDELTWELQKPDILLFNYFLGYLSVARCLNSNTPAACSCP